MDSIKGYFKKKNLERKFKRAGEGHTLSEEASARVEESKTTDTVRIEPGAESVRAGAAAIARLEQPKSVKKVHVATTVPVVAVSNDVNIGEREGQRAAEIQRVILICSFCNRSQSNKEIQNCLKDCLSKWYEVDPIEASASMLATLNTVKAADVCVSTLSKYVNNIISEPDEEKYRKIRINNKAFQERIYSVVGGAEFLAALGFTKKRLPHQDNEEDFLYLARESVTDVDMLKAALLVLTSAERQKPLLDRDMRVYRAASAAPRIELPPEFYSLEASEVKQEQATRSKTVATESELRTRAMREKDEQKKIRRYIYTIIRVKFPDDALIQGTFFSKDTIGTVSQFIHSCLCNEALVYTLTTSLGKKLDNDNLTLSQMDLVPSAVLHVSWDTAIMSELERSHIIDTSTEHFYLKSGIKLLMQELC